MKTTFKVLLYICFLIMGATIIGITGQYLSMGYIDYSKELAIMWMVPSYYCLTYWFYYLLNKLLEEG